MKWPPSSSSLHSACSNRSRTDLHHNSESPRCLSPYHLSSTSVIHPTDPLSCEARMRTHCKCTYPDTNSPTPCQCTNGAHSTRTARGSKARCRGIASQLDNMRRRSRSRASRWGRGCRWGSSIAVRSLRARSKPGPSILLPRRSCSVFGGRFVVGRGGRYAQVVARG